MGSGVAPGSGSRAQQPQCTTESDLSSAIATFNSLFGYRVNYRRVLEIQARLLARVVTGELPRYPGFETR